MKNKILLIALSVLIFSCNQKVKTENNETQEIQWITVSVAGVGIRHRSLNANKLLAVCESLRPMRIVCESFKQLCESLEHRNDNYVNHARIVQKESRVISQSL